MNTDLSGATAGVDALSSVSLSTPDIGSGINFTAAGQPAYQSVTAQSGDSISTILGTSDPGAIGQFERINGLTSSTINAGTSYLVPTDLSNVTDADEALGQASLNTDNARLAQIGAQQSALAGSVPYYLNPDSAGPALSDSGVPYYLDASSAGPAVPPTPESPSLLGRAIQWLGSNQTVGASIDDVNLNDTAPSASGFFRGVVDVNVAGTLSGLAGAAVSAGNNPEAALYLDPAEAAAESQEIQTSANATQQSVYNALALGPGTPDQLANYQIGTYTAEGANLALGAYGLVRGGFALAGLSSGEALEPLAANATSNEIATEASSAATPGTAIQKYSYYPPNNGFLLTPTSGTLDTGYQFSRYGGFFNSEGTFQDFGNFVAPVNVPFEMRALPLGTDLTKPLTTYEVVNPIPDVLSGPAAPAFGQIGLGTQNLLPMTIQDYLDQGYIKIINQVVPPPGP